MKCDYCDNEAVVNYQRVWISWKIMKDGNYSRRFKEEFDLEEPTEDNNVHVCHLCEERWLNNELN